MLEHPRICRKSPYIIPIKDPLKMETIPKLKDHSGAQYSRINRGPIFETTPRIKHSIRLIPLKMSITQECKGTSLSLSLKASKNTTCHQSSTRNEDLKTILLATNWAMRYFNSREPFFLPISLRLLLIRMNIATLKLTSSILSHIHINDLDSRIVNRPEKKIV